MLQTGFSDICKQIDWLNKRLRNLIDLQDASCPENLFSGHVLAPLVAFIKVTASLKKLTSFSRPLSAKLNLSVFLDRSFAII